MCRPLPAPYAEAARRARALAGLPLVALLLCGCGAAGSADTPAAPADPTAAPAASPAAADARLVPAHRDYGHDPDGNGLFEQLVVEVALDVTRAGSLTVDAHLVDARGTVLAWGSLDPLIDRAAPLLTTAVPAGRQAVPVYFAGAGLRAADGPYTAQIRLVGAGGSTLDQASHTTAPYRGAAFQGAAAALRGISDQGLADSRGGYRALRVAVELELPADGALTVQGQLFAGEQFLADVTQELRLPAGRHTVALDFAGAALARAGRDGPYTLYLTLADGHMSENHTHTTGAYRAGSFHPDAPTP